MRVVQSSFEDLGAPLSQVTFCFVDLETTGGSPADSRITEIGAVAYRGGERLGSFQTLVDPETPIPRFITHLTGIDELTVRDAPPIEAALPSFLEFARGSVLVAHNASFDYRFLCAETNRLEYERPPGPPVCTAKLARRVLQAEVPNVRLATLADYFRTVTRPQHRALADAEACAEVFHGLLDLGGRLGILTLSDLRGAMRARGTPHWKKASMADGLPNGPGVYLFRRKDGGVLYVGKAKDVRARARSYFYGDDRKQIDDLLASAEEVEAIPCRTEVEALVLEARLIRRHSPPFNRQGKAWRRACYLKLDLAEAWPRLKVVRKVSGDGAYLGPFRNSKQAALAKEALEEVVPIRRCTTSMGRSTRFSPCALADLGRCAAPCDSRVTPERYEELVRSLHSFLLRPGGLLAALEERMEALAEAERFEDARLARDRIRALVTALARARIERWLVGAGRLEVESEEGLRLVFREGALERRGNERGFTLPVPLDAADEVRAASGWLAKAPLRLVGADRPPAEPIDGGEAIARLARRLAAASSR